MLSQLDKLGFPQILIAWITGIAMGFFANAYWTEQRVAAVDAQKQQLVEQTAVLQSQLEKQQKALNFASQNSCQHMQVQLADLEGKVRQFAKSNQEWSAAFHNLQKSNQQLIRAGDLTHQLEDLREKWRTASRYAQDYAFVRCSDPSYNCDLSATSQRKLRALEAERDQLHAQILALQSHLTCEKP